MSDCGTIEGAIEADIVEDQDGVVWLSIIPGDEEILISRDQLIAVLSEMEWMIKDDDELQT